LLNSLINDLNTVKATFRGLDVSIIGNSDRRIRIANVSSVFWILKVAADHPDAEAFPKSSFRTQFLQRWLWAPHRKPTAQLGTGTRNQSQN